MTFLSKLQMVVRYPQIRPYDLSKYVKTWLFDTPGVSNMTSLSKLNYGGTIPRRSEAYDHSK